MALDPSHVGHTFPPTPPYSVSREKIREFADAIGAADPAYRDPAAAAQLGHPDVIAPPTFPIVFVAGLHAALTDMGLDFARVVHGEQRFAYTRPVRAGDRLVCHNTIEEITSRAGHAFVTTRTEVTTESGEPVVTFWCRLVERGEAGAAA